MRATSVDIHDVCVSNYRTTRGQKGVISNAGEEEEGCQEVQEALSDAATLSRRVLI
jgi:hypothetical protein